MQYGTIDGSSRPNGKDAITGEGGYVVAEFNPSAEGQRLLVVCLEYLLYAGISAGQITHSERLGANIDTRA